MKKIILILIASFLLGWTAYQNVIDGSANIEYKENPSPTDKNEEENQSDIDLQTGLEIGQRSPNFRLINLNGEEVALSDYHGKKVILNFWATWCTYCREGMPHKQEIYEKYKEEGVEVIAVNITKSETSQKQVEDYVTGEGLTFTVLLDELGDVTRMYRIQGTPTTYFIDSEGVLQGKRVGLMNYEGIEQQIKIMN
jgi:peroxiredoxin